MKKALSGILAACTLLASLLSCSCSGPEGAGEDTGKQEGGERPAAGLMVYVSEKGSDGAAGTAGADTGQQAAGADRYFMDRIRGIVMPRMKQFSTQLF